MPPSDRLPSWWWDGTVWRPSPGAPGAWWYDGRQWVLAYPLASVRRNQPRAVRGVWGALSVQAVGTVTLGVIAFAVGVISALSGSQWLVLAAVSCSVGVAASGLGAVLLLLSRRIDQRSRRVRLITIGVQSMLVPVGIALLAVANYATEHAGTPQNPGTDGPFADGEIGLIGLLGYAYVLGGLIVIALLVWSRQFRVARPESVSRKAPLGR